MGVGHALPTAAAVSGRPQTTARSRVGIASSYRSPTVGRNIRFVPFSLSAGYARRFAWIAPTPERKCLADRPAA